MDGEGGGRPLNCGIVERFHWEGSGRSKNMESQNGWVRRVLEDHRSTESQHSWVRRQQNHAVVEWLPWEGLGGHRTPGGQGWEGPGRPKNSWLSWAARVHGVTERLGWEGPGRAQSHGSRAGLGWKDALRSPAALSSLGRVLGGSRVRKDQELGSSEGGDGGGGVGPGEAQLQRCTRGGCRKGAGLQDGVQRRARS